MKKRLVFVFILIMVIALVLIKVVLSPDGMPPRPCEGDCSGGDGGGGDGGGGGGGYTGSGSSGGGGIEQQTCSDGTIYGKCSNLKKYCDNGNLVEKCSICGCFAGYTCQNETCISAINCQEGGGICSAACDEGYIEYPMLSSTCGAEQIEKPKIIAYLIKITGFLVSEKCCVPKANVSWNLQQDPNKICNDGTKSGECNTNKKFCDNGNLVEKCSFCGCSPDLKCVDDKCIEKNSCEKSNGYCSSSCDNGYLEDKTYSKSCNPTGVIPYGEEINDKCCRLICQPNIFYGKCSQEKPLYCDNGFLKNNCQICGCEIGYDCTISGECIKLNEEDLLKEALNLTGLSNNEQPIVSGFVPISDIERVKEEPKIISVDIPKNEITTLVKDVELKLGKDSEGKPIIFVNIKTIL